MEKSDKELLEAIADRDEKAFNEFYKRYSFLLHKFALNRIGSTHASNDVGQDFWSNVWLKPQNIRTNDAGSAKNFLLSFYTYRILDYLRNPHQKEKAVDSEKHINSIEYTLAYTHILEEIEEKEIHILIDEILESLPKLTREIFVYRWEEQHSIKETASHFDVDEKTVYNRTYVALTAVRSKVKDMLSDEVNLADPKTLLNLLVLLSLFKD